MKNLTLLLLCLPLFAVGQPGNVTVKDDAKVGVVNTGNNPTFNIDQSTKIIFGKSPEYAEIKKTLATLEADIQKKADQCEQMANDSLPAKYRDGCRAELIALNARRDSVQKLKTSFEEFIIRLAERITKEEHFSERLEKAKTLISEGKIREAEAVLDVSTMKAEGDALLARKERLDSLLSIKADEFALKAILKAADYQDLLRMDSAELYFEQSLRYGESIWNYLDFAATLFNNRRYQKAFNYWSHAVDLAHSVSEEQVFSSMVGTAFKDILKRPEAESMFLRSLRICERESPKNPSRFLPCLAFSAQDLGDIYFDTNEMSEAERMYRNSIKAFEEFRNLYPSVFIWNRAEVAFKLGRLYFQEKQIAKADTVFQYSLKIYEQMTIDSTSKLISNYAALLDAIGSLNEKQGRISEAWKYYSRSFHLLQKGIFGGNIFLLKELHRPYANLGSVRDSFSNRGDISMSSRVQMERAEVLYSMKEVDNKILWGAATAYNDLYLQCYFGKMYKQAAAAAQKVLELAPARNWIRPNLGHAYLLSNDWPKAKAVYTDYISKEKDPAAAKDALQKDLDDLEAAGITCPEMAQARAWLKE